MSTLRYTAAALVLGMLGTAGCSTGMRTGRAEPAPEVVVIEHRDRGPANRDEHGRLRVPPGHLPPPGECRVWFPGRPPGHQPPPTSYAAAERRAPAGSWVLYRPKRDRHVVHARVIDEHRDGVVVRVVVYDAARGTYLRTEEP